MMNKTIKCWGNYMDGILPVNFHLFQILSPEATIILCEILSEYKYACTNNLNMEEHFLVDFRRLADYLLIGDDMILEELATLEKYGLITACTPGMGNTLLVWVHEDRIIQFLEFCKTEYSPHKWDWGLKDTQNPRVQDTSFDNKTTNALMHFVNKNIKNPEKIPMVTYAYCSMISHFYNLDKINFMENKDVQNLIYEYINFEKFEPMRLPEFIDFLGQKMQKGK